MRPGSHVRDDVDLLSRVLERALEPEVVVRRHNQLVRRSLFAQQHREAGKEAMERPGLHGGLESSMKLVVERAGTLHHRHVLGDAREIDRPVVRHAEGGREVLRATRRLHRAR